MRLFDSSFANSNYDKWFTSEPEGHPYECNCPDCHEYHVKEGEWVTMAIDEGHEFRCCAEELQIRIENGARCKIHPYSGVVKATKDTPMICDWCEEEKV